MIFEIRKHGQSILFNTNCQIMQSIANHVFDVIGLSDNEYRKLPVIVYHWEKKDKYESLNDALIRLYGKDIRKQGNSLYGLGDNSRAIVTRYRYGWLICKITQDNGCIEFDTRFLWDIGLIKRFGIFIRRKNSSLQHKVAHDVHRIVLYYPLLYLLQFKDNYQIFHASAIDISGKGVIFMGAPGCGKSSLAMQLLKQDNVKLLSDNLVLVRNGCIYDCYEFMRLDEHFVKKIEMDNDFKMIWQDWTSERSNYAISEPKRVNKSKSSLIVFTSFSNELHFNELTFEDAYLRHRLSNQLAPEVTAYMTYRIMVESVSKSQLNDINLEQFKLVIGNIGCVELGIPRDDHGIERCIDIVKDRL